MKPLALLLASTALFASPAFAEVADMAPAAPAAQDFHEDESPEIVITGFRRNREDVLSGTSVLSGADLARDLRPTIGETLTRQPGVSATAFGPNASRPVLRGFQGERVRVLTDGIGSLDVSNTSVDHAVAINPLTADRIEVLRGPSALLFGSAAIGGVVNVIYARIPRRIPEESIHVQGLATYGSAADERSVNGAVDVPLGSGFVAHVDGNYSKSNDLEIGGYVLTPALRAQVAASGDPAIQELATLRGKLPNTAAETSDIAGGIAWIDGDNNVGVSINRYDNLYGVPIRYSLDPALEAEAPRIDIHQTRVDGRAEIDTGSGFIDSVRLRAGYSDYQHNELEETGEIGTSFFNKGYEGRLELVQSHRGGFGGGFGLQYFHRDFDVEGEEKFLPANTTSQLGIFGLESYEAGPFRAEAGLRYEHQEVDADADADLGNAQMSRSFDSLSGSIGASYAIAPRVRLGLNLSRTERAPSAEELYANGPHAGTQAFEIGDPDLRPEKSWGLELTLHADGEGFSFGGSIFQSWFNDYIYESQTGAIEDDLPVFQISQADARYFGIELEGSVKVATVGGYAINLDGVADYVRATIDNVGPAPRIPPFRLLGGIEAQGDRLNGRLEGEHVFEQDRTALNETSTESFTLVNASLNWKPFEDHRNTTITFSANNIFDVDARRHASFLKDYAPLPGRDLRVSLRFDL